jgi:histidinol-phosphate aminotransferase
MVAAHAAADGEALLDWNESPIGVPPQAAKRVIDAAHRIHRYPRGLMEEVAELAAIHFRVEPDQILLTAGVDEAIDLTLSLASRAWGVRPGFDGYEDRARANGKPFRPIGLGPDWQPTAPPDQAIGTSDIVFLAVPGNPTGNLLPATWIDAVRRSAGYTFVDETYAEFSSHSSLLEYVRGGADRRLLVYRSFSKAAGLAGIRLGCLIGAPEVIGDLQPLRRFMPIDAVSLHAAAGLLEEPEFLAELSAYVRRARPQLCSQLRASALFDDVRESEANFVLARPAAGSAPALFAQLARDRVRVKDAAVLGLPGWLRISVGTPQDHARLLASLGRVPTTPALLTSVGTCPVGAF